MKFCRSCGSSLPAPTMAASPAAMAAYGAANNQLPSTAPGLLAPNVPGPGLPPTLPPANNMGGIGGMVGMPSGPMPGGAPPPLRPAAGGIVTCPRCGTATPSAFAYCQQCGLHLQAVAPTDPGPRTGRPSVPPPIGPTNVVRPPPIDPQGATVVPQNAGLGAARPSQPLPPLERARPSSVPPLGMQQPMQQPMQQQPIPQAVGPAASAPVAQQMPQWGTAVLVNRDGSDGERYPLAAEYSVVGRAGADIAFPDDRFLSRQHARIERDGSGVKVHSLDPLNGVFRKADGPVELADGMVILVGREVLRFEAVDPEERVVQPLVRHGVALFGSPPREPWGRLVQIVPSGGWRDIRHLSGEEVVLGREDGDIVFRDDAFMSRRHAALTWNGQRATITDLGSSNGTFVRIAGPISVKHGDHLRLGDQLLRIELGR